MERFQMAWEAGSSECRSGNNITGSIRVIMQSAVSCCNLRLILPSCNSTQQPNQIKTKLIQQKHTRSHSNTNCTSALFSTMCPTGLQHDFPIQNSLKNIRSSSSFSKCKWPLHLFYWPIKHLVKSTRVRYIFVISVITFFYSVLGIYIIPFHTTQSHPN